MGDPVKVGNKVPLSAQVQCPAGTIFIRAFITDESNTPLATRDLLDQGDGRFENFSYTMPNEDIISVQYIAFDSALYTTQLEEPCPGTEVFQKLEEGSGGAGNPEAGIMALGKIISPLLRGKVLGGKILTGSVMGSTLRGRVFSLNIIQGKILNSTIKGRVI